MNLNIPINNEKTTEIDLVLIHETGIYVFEIKYYKGTIYGGVTGNIWTQYFRTSKNNTFKNPILQNDYHINALKNLINDVPINSVIVFTNEDCKIKVDNNNPDIELCTFSELIENLENRFKNKNKILTLQQIETIFDSLTKYSSMQEITVYEGKEERFATWLQPIITSFEEKKESLSKQIEKNKKNSLKPFIINITIILLLFIGFIGSVYIIQEKYDKNLNDAKQNYDKELNKFKQNFKHIDEIDNEYIAQLNQHFIVSDVSLQQISESSLTFTAKISRTTDMYGMALTNESKYIVMTSNNMVYEYNVFGEHLEYNRFSNMIGKGIRDYDNLASITFLGIKKRRYKLYKAYKCRII